MTDSSLLSSYRLTRDFAIGALVVTVLAAAVSVQAHRHLLTSRLLETIERSAAVQARTIADSPWPRFAYFIHSAERLEAGEIGSYWQTEDLRREIGDLLAGTKVLNVRLHDARGRTVFSTDEAEIGGHQSADPGLRAALAGDSASRLAFAEGWVLSSYVPLRSPDADGVAGVVEIHSDVSDLEPYLAQARTGGTGLIAGAFAIVFLLLLAMVWLAERRLHRQQEAGRAAEPARTPSADQPKLELMGHLSHEIRTPLNTILGFAETIKDGLFGPLGNTRYVEYSNDIYDSGQHLLKIVNDALDIADLESGRLTADNGPVDLMETAQAAIGSLGDQAEAAEVEIRLEAPSDIGGVVSDGERIRQVLVNLLSNGVKFTPTGGSVTLALERVPSGAVRFCMSDTGIGMKQDEIPFALSPFSQIDVSITNKRPGSGLGLPLSRKVVELLGGKLELESELGIGTTVTFTLPDRAEAAADFAAASAA
ncbi:MAG: HAMP domain-containing histidine kinase [Rhodospirillales bacterium]|nr:HAMP domain-containing histidine kinase [Rhodospirillales bacterium]MDH3910179.1 HAMP domain-containing histidine kinase [Rhodospirillales bacterium]MDH3966677.1 HAMP domain-containing histidine kinase [Rhodospirillales bacterium]